MTEKKTRRFNIVDILVLILVVIIAVAVVLKLTGHLGPATANMTTSVTYTVKVPDVDKEIYENIQQYFPDDQLMADGALVDGYVKSVTAEPHVNKVTVSSADEALIIPAQGDTLDLTFTITANGVSATTTKIGTQEVRVGKEHIVKTTHFEFTKGEIVSCDWTDGTAADAIKAGAA